MRNYNGGGEVLPFSKACHVTPINPSCDPALYILFYYTVNISFLGYAATNSSHGFRLYSTTREGKYWSQFIFDVYCIQLRYIFTHIPTIFSYYFLIYFHYILIYFIRCYIKFCLENVLRVSVSTAVAQMNMERILKII